ncbi:MAG: hypothetical protein HOZ81_32860 [Streptomyces sp.]|nr:hypothetical protein [Streptomyces sp.]NUS89466.1 hypothetical protein [Streptomyces sp.]
MLATQERVRLDGGQVAIVWHRSPGRCNGECDFHPIACSADEGIIAPGPKQDVPIRLEVPGERWCSDCLAIIRVTRTK